MASHEIRLRTIFVGPVSFDLVSRGVLMCGPPTAQPVAAYVSAASINTAVVLWLWTTNNILVLLSL